MMTFIALLFSALVAADNYSNYTNTNCTGEVSLMLMADESGDGWSGNVMTISQDGVTSTFTLDSGSSAIYCDIDVMDASCVYVEVGGGSTTELGWEIDVSSNSSEYVGASGGVGITWLEGDEVSCAATAAPTTTGDVVVDDDSTDAPVTSGDDTTTVTTISFGADTVVDDAFINGIEAAYLEQLPAGTTVTVTVTLTTTGTMTLGTDGSLTEADLAASLSVAMCPATGECSVSVEFVARRRLQDGSTTFTFTMESDPNAEAPSDTLNSDDFEAALIAAVAAETGSTVTGVTVSDVEEAITATVTVDGEVSIDESALSSAVEANTGVEVTGVSTEVQAPEQQTTDAPATAPDSGDDQGIDFGSAGRVASSLATLVAASALALAF